MNKPIITIVGLGYVGLPLAYQFAKNGYTVHGFDINKERIEQLQNGQDTTNELTSDELGTIEILFSADPAVINKGDIIILAIPTPIDDEKKPNLAPLEAASHTVGKHIKSGAIVVYESTVYPGVTEEICGPILEKESGMKCGTDFYLGYSPERVNPGDKKHTIDKIVKVVAGQDAKTTDTLCELYGSIVTAGIHRAPDIKTAEMSKAIENAQRDLNIAYVNEVSMLCHKIGINTSDVLEAAATKWNFLQYQPGLVGGHCIGVDPYYLVEKAKMLGMETHVITAGRSVNDAVPQMIADEVLAAGGKGKVLVMGMTFKEDVPDTRNSQSMQVVKALEAAGCEVLTHDAQVGGTGSLDNGPFDAVLLLVKHKEYIGTEEDIIHATKDGGVIYDVKGVLDAGKITASGRKYRSL